MKIPQTICRYKKKNKKINSSDEYTNNNQLKFLSYVLYK
jgi:hypothetical protein